MSYFPQGNTTLVARRGYSDTSGWFDKVLGVGKGVIDFYGEKQKAEGRAEAWQQQAQQAQQTGGLPSWLLPVGLVVGGVLLVKSLRK